MEVHSAAAVVPSCGVGGKQQADQGNLQGGDVEVEHSSTVEADREGWGSLNRPEWGQ